MAAPILSLDSLVDRPVVLIDQVEYELLTPALLPPLDAHRYQRYSERCLKLMDQDTLTPEEEHELEQLPDKMCRLVLVAADAVHDKLTTRERVRICATFLRRPPVTPPAGSGEPVPALPSTGESSSHA